MKKAAWQQYPNIDVCASFLNQSQLEATGLFQSVNKASSSHCLLGLKK